MISELGASIVVPSRGGARRLPILLAALSQQDCQDFEVIVVLDEDIDGSKTLLDRFAVQAGMRIRSLVFPENKGRSAALNAGAAVARGRILIRCDDDLQPESDYVSAHLSAHGELPAGVIGLYRNLLPETSYARYYGRAADERFRDRALATDVEFQWRYWAGNVSVPRKIHEQLGGYDEDYRTYGWEDVDYGYRLHRLGVPVRIDPRLTTIHHVAATTTAVRALRALHSGAAREVFLMKHGASALADQATSRGFWAHLVELGGALATETTVRRAGNVVDAASNFLPRWVSEKFIALIVESAGRGGVRHPERARAYF